MDTPDAHIQALARFQGGVVTVRQALALGMSKSAITRRVRAKKWEPLVRGVLLVNLEANRFDARCWAAMLATSSDAPVLSHTTAGELHGMLGLPPGAAEEPIHLSFARDQPRAQRPGMRLHWSEVPAEHCVDLAWRQRLLFRQKEDEPALRGRLQPLPFEALRVTSIPRTLVDLALTTDRLTTVATTEWALREGLDLRRLGELLVGRRGGRQVEGWWALLEPRSANRLETWVRLALRDGGLHPEAVKYPIYYLNEKFTVAMAFISRRVVVDVDDREPAARLQGLRWSQRRRHMLQEAGWVQLVFTPEDQRSPGYVCQTVKRTLVNRPYPGIPAPPLQDSSRFIG